MSFFGGWYARRYMTAPYSASVSPPWLPRTWLPRVCSSGFVNTAAAYLRLAGQQQNDSIPN
ncbi:hypothetical protein E2C01_059761 [Portunus trituberculatus]|uniref:Uncharacterized protein n=1 Tax=Portunus trituberculatus TaxID=210409 RepID=A0A5B7H695_PORTR|nr:hypothetical protein [Portunus trituberculatus]